MEKKTTDPCFEYERIIKKVIQPIRRDARRTSKAHMEAQHFYRVKADQYEFANTVLGGAAAMTPILLSQPSIMKFVNDWPKCVAITSILWATGFYISRETLSYYRGKQARYQGVAAKWNKLHNHCVLAQATLVHNSFTVKMPLDEAFSMYTKLQREKEELDVDPDSITHDPSYQKTKKNADEFTDRAMEEIERQLEEIRKQKL